MSALLFPLLLGAALLAALRWPVTALGSALALFGLEQMGQALHSPLAGALGGTFTNIAVGSLVLVATAIRAASGGFGRLTPAPENLLVFALLAYALVSVAWTPDPELAVAQWRTEAPYLITFVFLAPLLCTGPADLRRALLATMLLGAAVCAAVLAFGDWGRRGLITDPRFYRLEANPLAIASLAGQALITAALLPAAWRRPLRWLPLVVVAPLALAVIAKSGSRGQLLAVFAALAVAWPLVRAGGHAGVRAVVTWSVVAALAAGVYLSLALLGAEADRWNSDRISGDVGGRTEMAMTLLRAASSGAGSLFFGLGNSASFDLLGVYPHIVPLEILGEEGLIGLALFIALLIAVATRLARLLSDSAHRPDDRAVHAALLAGVVFHLLLSFKQGSLLGSPFLLMHAMIVGRLVAPAGNASADAAVATAPVPATRPASAFPNLMR